MANKYFNQTKKALKNNVLKRKDAHDDDDDGSGRGGTRGRGGSYLGDDTQERENKRRKIEITGLIAATGLASEARRDRDDPYQASSSLEDGLEAIPSHPILGDKQQFDGLDPDVNPIPDLTTPEGQEAYQLQQQLQMQKRLELQNRLQSSIKPAGP
jgi:hypothetical protein